MTMLTAAINLKVIRINKMSRILRIETIPESCFNEQFDSDNVHNQTETNSRNPPMALYHT